MSSVTLIIFYYLKASFLWTSHVILASLISNTLASIVKLDRMHGHLQLFQSFVT